MSINPEELAKLPQQLRQGGLVAERAAGRLYDALWRPLMRFFMRSRQDEALAEDLTNETLAKAVMQISSLRDDSAFLGWVWKIARNQLRGHIREVSSAVASETALDEEGWQVLFETHADISHGDIVVRLCLQGQLERFRQDHPERAFCIEQAVLDDWDGHALAAFLGRSYGAAREYLSQCRKKIAEYLRPCLDSGHADQLA